MSEPTYEELKARLAALEEKNKARGPRAIDFKVSEKGGVSVYGLGRFPVTSTTSSGFACWTRRRSCASF